MTRTIAGRTKGLNEGLATAYYEISKKVGIRLTIDAVVIVGTVNYFMTEVHII